MPAKADKRKPNSPKPEPRGSKIRAARVEPVHPVVCFVGGSRAKLTVKDISVNGLSVWSTMPLSRGFVHEFRLIYGQMTVVRPAHIVHCKQCDDVRWLVGLEFDKETHRGPTIADLVDLITDETHVPVWS